MFLALVVELGKGEAHVLALEFLFLVLEILFVFLVEQVGFKVGLQFGEDFQLVVLEVHSKFYGAIAVERDGVEDGQVR